MVFVRPGFLVGLVFRKPCFRRILQTVVADISIPARLSRPARSVQGNSRLYRLERTFSSTACTAFSVCFKGRPDRGAS
jgi:hypothetical protein